MADEGTSDEAEWLVAPAGAGEVRLLLDVGEGVELTAEQTEALGNLVEALEGSEVEGFAMGGAPSLKLGLLGDLGPGGFGISTCSTFVCKSHTCTDFGCSTYKSSLTGPSLA